MPSSTSVPDPEKRDAELAALLAARTRFAHFRHVPSCESTQALAGNAEPGTLIWADHQTLGRGRRGRTWSDQPGLDLALSFVLHNPSSTRPARLPAAIPVAISRCLEKVSGQSLTIKWPNDILAGPRKISGILIDAAGGSTRCVAGIGININGTRFAPELGDIATSLALLTGRETDRYDVVGILTQELEDVLLAVESGAVRDLAQEFAARTGLIGQRVEFAMGSRTGTGVLTDLDLDTATVGSEPIALGVLQRLRPVVG